MWVALGVSALLLACLAPMWIALWGLRKQQKALTILQKRVALLNRAAIYDAQERAKLRAQEQETTRMTAEELAEFREKERKL